MLNTNFHTDFLADETPITEVHLKPQNVSDTVAFYITKALRFFAF